MTYAIADNNSALGVEINVSVLVNGLKLIVTVFNATSVFSFHNLLVIPDSQTHLFLFYFSFFWRVPMGDGWHVITAEFDWLWPLACAS